MAILMAKRTGWCSVGAMERWQRSQRHRPLMLMARLLLTPEPTETPLLARRDAGRHSVPPPSTGRLAAPAPPIWKTPLRVLDTGAHIRQGLSHMFDASTTLEGVAFAPLSAITC